jgi:hypothetical protein
MFLLIGVVGLLNAVPDNIPPVPQPSVVSAKSAFTCKVPEFLVNLPPQMEGDYKECVNNKNMPTQMKAKVVLREYVSKKAQFISIEPHDNFFTRVYKVNYKIDDIQVAMLCNESLTYCVSDKPIVKK